MKLKLILLICTLVPFLKAKNSPFCEKLSPTDQGVSPDFYPSNDIGKIETHQFLLQTKNKTTAIKYHIAAALTEPKKGTLLYLCGGPGFACPKRAINLPDNYDIVTIPYLGVGDNRVLNKPDEMSIDSQGEAVSQLINHLAKPDITILAHSYGTAVATTAASKFTHLSDSKKQSTLQGVFLTGVVGPSANFTYGSEYPAVAEQAWQRLSKTEQARFRSVYLKTSAGMKDKDKNKLNNILSSPLIFGPKRTAETLQEFIKKPKDFIVPDMPSKTPPEVIDGVWQQRAAACELFENTADLKNTKVFGGLVVPYSFSPDICKCRLLAANWDPSKYQIKGVPVLYLNGMSDPATPVESAKKHFDGQIETSEKVFLAEPNGGHGEFFDPQGKMMNCVPIFLDHIANKNLKSLEKNQDKYMKDGCPEKNQLIPNSFPTENTTK